MSNEFSKKLANNQLVGCDMTNSHPTSTETIINCCFDYFKFVIPFSTNNKYEMTNPYQDIYRKLKNDLPELTDDEIFKIIDLDFPGVHPGVVYKKREGEFSDDVDTGVWSLNKIRITLEHWFKIEKFIPEASRKRIKKIGGFGNIIEYTPGINFMYDGPEMNYIYEGKTYSFKTCCIELKGEGCRKVEEFGVSLINILSYLLKIPGIHATRVDFAIDLLNDNTITMDWLKEKIFNKVSWVGSFREARPVPHYKFRTINQFRTVELIGDGIEFGSKASTSRLNIYDKKLERIENAGFDVTINSWIRFELQCFTEKANNVINMLMKEILHKKFNVFCSELILGSVDIKINENLYHEREFRPGKTKTWPTDPKWANFLKATQKIKVKSQAKLEADFIKTRNWFNRSGMSTQVKLDMLYQEDPSTKIESLLRQIEILEDFDDSDLNQFNQYRKKMLKASKDLTYEDITKHIESLKAEVNMLQKFYNMEEE